jgi:hypothetical protein
MAVVKLSGAKLLAALNFFFHFQHVLAVGLSPSAQIEPLCKQFQIVLLEAAACGVVLLGSERQPCAIKGQPLKPRSIFFTCVEYPY